MQLTVTGKQIEIGDALRVHVESSLDSILDKYFRTAIEAHVVVAKEAHLIRAEISLHVGRGIVVNAGAAVGEVYAAFDTAAERLAKQLRRYKRRLRDHHAKAREPAEVEERARDYVLAPVVLFRNRAHGELNLVYRRADGNIGWIDPELDPVRQAHQRHARATAIAD